MGMYGHVGSASRIGYISSRKERCTCLSPGIRQAATYWCVFYPSRLTLSAAADTTGLVRRDTQCKMWSVVSLLSLLRKLLLDLPPHQLPRSSLPNAGSARARREDGAADLGEPPTPQTQVDLVNVSHDACDGGRGQADA